MHVLALSVRLDLQCRVGHDRVAQSRLGEAWVLEGDESVPFASLPASGEAHLQRFGLVERAKAAQVRRDEWDEHGVAADRRELVQVANPDSPVLQLIRRVARGLVGGVEVVGGVVAAAVVVVGRARARLVEPRGLVGLARLAAAAGSR
jgi:hypothetical protein